MQASIVTVGTTPTLIASGGSNITPLSVTMLAPTGGVTVYIGGPAVTTATGFPVAAGGAYSADLKGSDWYAIVAASTQAVNVLKEH